MFKKFTLSFLSLIGILTFVAPLAKADVLPPGCIYDPVAKNYKNSDNEVCRSNTNDIRYRTDEYVFKPVETKWFYIAPLLTLAIELPIVLGILKTFNMKKLGKLAAINIATNLSLIGILSILLNHTTKEPNSLNTFTNEYYTPVVIVLEMIIIAIEGYLISRFLKVKIKRAMLISLIANIASVAIGFILTDYLNFI